MILEGHQLTIGYPDRMVGTALDVRLETGEVLALLARGWSNRRIAGDLGVADITVRTHVSHILGKLGAANRVEAALYALRGGMAQQETC